jgi:AcrR family transcriptional regulator
MFRLSIEGVMSDKPEDPGDGVEPQGNTDRRVRADAQRNLDALLQSAKAVFATSGVDAPVREIAERAGVGIGTFYRHFPQRSDLIAAVFRHEIDACAEAASILAAEHALRCGMRPSRDTTSRQELTSRPTPGREY